MIEFPQKLHRIHQFQHNGRLGAADLDIGCVVVQDKSVRSKAIQLPSFRERPMYDALATTLLVEHTSVEVEAVLTHIFKEQKKAKEILFRVSEKEKGGERR